MDALASKAGPRGLLAARAPEAALLALAIFGAGSMGSKPLSLALAGILALMAYLGLRPGIGELLSDLRFLLALALVLFLFQALDMRDFRPRIDPDGAHDAALASARIAASYAAARAFYAGMSLSRIRDGLARLARPFERLLGVDPFASLALALGFVPAVLGIWSETEEAARARGYGLSASGLGFFGRRLRHLHSLSALLAAFLRRLLLLSRDVAEARALRAFGAARRSLPPFRFDSADLLLVSLAALPLAVELLR